jgi:hypothetical protein
VAQHAGRTYEAGPLANTRGAEGAGNSSDAEELTMGAVDKIVAGIVAVIRKDGYFDRVIWKVLATMRGKQPKEKA